jgi:hypothetical protein
VNNVEEKFSNSFNWELWRGKIGTKICHSCNQCLSIGILIISQWFMISFTQEFKILNDTMKSNVWSSCNYEFLFDAFAHSVVCLILQKGSSTHRKSQLARSQWVLSNIVIVWKFCDEWKRALSDSWMSQV